MLSVADARAKVKRIVERSQRAWAAALSDSSAGLEHPASAVVDLPLHPPTEKAALADTAAAINWARAWGEVDGDGIEVVWVERSWPSAGTQRVPLRLRISGARAMAQFAGTGGHWKRLAARATTLGARMRSTEGSIAAAVQRHALTIAGYEDAAFDQLLDVVDWLVDNPASGKRIRELPIRGVDTKWLERHRSVTEDLFRARTGWPGLGLAESKSMIRVRFLDETLRPGGIADAALSLAGLATLGIRPEVVFVFENLESVLAMPDVPGAVVVHGSGYAAGRLAQVPWIRAARVLYWGDLDSDGFQILSRLRASGVEVSSVLMDVAAIERYRDLAGLESRTAPGDLSSLTDREAAAVALLQSLGGLRIEQERIPWTDALELLLSRV